jgi:hypothetical protein
MFSISRTLSAWAALPVLLFSSFSGQAAVALNSGQSYQTSFALQSDGSAFKISDYEWEIEVTAVDSDNPPGNYGGTGFVTVTLFENVDFSSPVFNFTVDSGASSVFGGSFDSRFSDLSGSLVISYTGSGVLDLQQITISNLAGAEAPSFVATTTFVPMASQVPWPPAALLFVPGLLITGLAAARRRRGEATA